MSKITKGIICLLSSALIYSLLPVLIRFLDAEKIQPMSQVLMRYLFAFLAAAGYFYWSKTKFVWEKKSLLLLILTAVFGYALCNLFFTYGMLFTQVSTALFIFFSFAIMTPILAMIFLKEKVNKFNIIGLIISLLALLMLFQPNALATWKVGGLFALLAALGQSFYLIARKKLMQYSSSQLLMTSAGCGIITLALLVAWFEPGFYTSVPLINGKTWLAAAVAGVMNFSGWFLMTKGFGYVKASVGSLIMLVENVFVAVVGYMFFREVPTIIALFGGLMILSAAALVTVKGDNS